MITKVQRMRQRSRRLLWFGILWLVMAWSVWNIPIPTNRPLVAYEYLPAELRAGLWVITGLGSIVFAYLPERDRWGFRALLIMPAERATSWAFAVICHWLPLWPAPPLALSVTGFLVWGVLCKCIRSLWEQEIEVVPRAEL